MVRNFKAQCLVVLLSILINAIVSVMASLFIKTLIDTYITPFLSQAAPNFTPLLAAPAKMGAFYYIAVFFAYLQNRLMINICQGSLKEIRDDVFTKMERLPICYFDNPYPRGYHERLYE